MKDSQLTRLDFLKGACAGTIAAMVPFRGQAAQIKLRPNIDSVARGELTLSAVNIPRKQVMDIRLVTLTPLKSKRRNSKSRKKIGALRQARNLSF